MTETVDNEKGFCAALVGNPDMPNPAAKIGAWLAGVAQLTGGFPLELTMREIEKGFEKNGVRIEGTGNHSSSIRSAMDWLEDRGIIRTEEGRQAGFGHKARKIWMTV